MDDINNILRDLSIGKNYKGHREIAYAIQLLLEDEDRLCAVVKEVYIPVAKHFNVEWNAVERNLRTAISRVWRLRHGEYVSGKYLYADRILTHVKKKKKIGEYTLFVGKIPGYNVVFDGKYYAHCRNFRDGVADLLFKSAADRGAEQYRGISLDDSFTVEELKRMYRVITGACEAGTESFVNSLKDLKDKYTVREVIEMTEGKYGAEKFKAFFEGANE